MLFGETGPWDISAIDVEGEDFAAFRARELGAAGLGGPTPDWNIENQFPRKRRTDDIYYSTKTKENFQLLGRY